MAVSALATLREYLRQQATGDDKYFKYMLMFFELKIPAEVNIYAAAGVSFLFPLRVPPDSYTLDEPFTVEATPTQGGGVYVEENGIVQRTIRLSGTTGFAPKPLGGAGTLALAEIKPEKKSYTRSLNPMVLDNLSGQRHFQYLQDAVFRTYADLKRDPALAEETQLIFHIPKDDEHWLVVPQRFTLERSASQRTLYRYNIELLVIDKAEAVDEDFSEDGGFLEAISDAIATVKTAIALAEGAINDLTAIVSEIKSVINDVVQIIDGVSSVIEAAKNFVEGVTELIESPLAVLDALGGVIEAAGSFVDQWEESGQRIQSLPGKVKDKWKQLGDALEMLGTHPEKFEPDNNAEIRKNRNKLSPLLSMSPAAIEKAKALTVPSTVAGYNALGTQLTPGDIKEAEGAKLFIPKALLGKYRSARRVSISEGESLSSLAARYLKDARRWQDIAIINGLKPPFTNKQASLDLRKTDEAALPGVKGIGDRILIPSLSKGQADQPNPVTLGVRPEEPADVHFLGRDLKLELVTTVSNPGNPMYDIPIDVARGGIDLQTIQGLDNLSQGLTTRLITERGTDQLYKRLGMQRIIGTNQAPTDIDLARFRAIQALQQDGRVSAVRRVTFEGIDGGTAKPSDAPPDALVIDAEVEVRGFTESANVRIAV
jgi:hypothetical protein